ncbi:MAG: RusA family crossover junction endodeoxyribonuclease [Candidatus Thalassarchaeaceae archaeon]|nr:RusA family crossover junction endodeoxyribonuclease [Candidatus Thalassarchaeaceae archaeon]
MPASRPRVSKWGTYYGKRHKAFRSAASDLLSEIRAASILPEGLLSGRLRVMVSFFVKKPKTSKLEIPRGDIDNYIKILLDCCNGVIWEDDVLIEHICAHKTFATGEGWIELRIEENTDGITTANDTQPPEQRAFSLCGRGHDNLPDIQVSCPCR